MTRATPISPQVGEALLDRVLDQAPAPVTPVALAERIKRDVPRIPQFAPIDDLGEQGKSTESGVETQGGMHSAFATVRTGPAHRIKRRAIAIGVFGTLAASVVLVFMPRQDMQHGEVAVTLPEVQKTFISAAAPTPASTDTRTAPPPQNFASSSKGGQARSIADTGERPVEQSIPTVPLATPAVPDETVLAAGDAQKAAGGTDDAAKGSSAPVEPVLRGRMGPVLPQGYGYTGGMSAPAIPAGSPVKMSGGPGSGTP